MAVTYIHKNKVSPLVVDKVSFTLDLTLSEMADVMDRLNQLLKVPHGKMAFTPLYKKAANLYLGELGDHKLLVQVDSKISAIRNFRCEFNPASGYLGEVRGFLDHLVPDGGYSRVVEAGICTRIDLAVDVKGSHLSQLYVHIPKVTKSEARYGPALVETLYLGSAVSDKQLCAYDKKPRLKRRTRGWRRNRISLFMM